MMRIAAGVGLILATAALFDLWQEYQVWQAEQSLSRIETALSRGAAPSLPPVAVAGSDLPPRAAVYRALGLARAAAGQRDAAGRTRMLEAARDDIDHAKAARPGWGEAEMTSAYIALVASHGRPSNAALRDYAASYRDAVFLRDAARWRATTGLALWSRLDPVTRGHVVDEAVLLGRLSADERPAMFAAARRSAGYFDFARVWIAMRHGDADMTVSKVNAPS